MIHFKRKTNKKKGEERREIFTIRFGSIRNVIFTGSAISLEFSIRSVLLKGRESSKVVNTVLSTFFPWMTLSLFAKRGWRILLSSSATIYADKNTGENFKKSLSANRGRLLIAAWKDWLRTAVQYENRSANPRISTLFRPPSAYRHLRSFVLTIGRNE